MCFICAQSALDKHLHKRLATVLTAKCKRQKKKKQSEGDGAFFSFHFWICFNAFIQMHLRYCPTVTSQFTIKIRFCFLLALFFSPSLLAWVECSVGKAVCMQIRATQGELVESGPSRYRYNMLTTRGGQEGHPVSNVKKSFCLANKPYARIIQPHCSLVIMSGCSGR